MQQQRGVATVVEDHVRKTTVWPRHHLFRAPPVLLECLALPCEHRHTLWVVDCSVRADHDGCRSMVLSREDVATRPANFRSQFHECLDEDSSLDGHVQRTGDPCTLQRLAATEFLAQRTQSGHFMFGEMDFLATEWREVQVGDAIVATRGER